MSTECSNDYIRYKGLDHAVLSDAPFVGARLCAVDCDNNCPGCFNQVLRKQSFQLRKASDIIQEVLDNRIDTGIIFGGLEWTLQPTELSLLVTLAHKAGLKVIVYTHHSLKWFYNHFPEFNSYDNMWVKCGEFMENSKPYYDAEHDVTLASENQKIYNYPLTGMSSNPESYQWG